MKEKIKELRVSIDGLAQLTKGLKPQNNVEFAGLSAEPATYWNSREIEKAAESLYFAKAWLGKVLGELGNENPYGSGYKKVSDIVETQDVSSVGGGARYTTMNHIEKVDWLRTEIKNLIEILTLIPTNNSMVNKFSEIVYIHLTEARFWLGFELERIKNR